MAHTRSDRTETEGGETNVATDGGRTRHPAVALLADATEL